MWIPPRSYRPEWMDRDDNSKADLRAALGEIRRVNRFLGGSKTILDALRPLLDRGATRPFEILDVGTGGGDLPLEMLRLARRKGCSVRVTALDRDPHTAELALELTRDHAEIRVVQADAFQLPFAPGSFDVVTASMFLHHFDEAAAARLIGGFLRVARGTVLINDLRRHWLPWAFILLVARLGRRSPMFAHDAPLSVLRGFTPKELLEVAHATGASDCTVRRRWPYRLLLTARTGDC